jgi:hypothetical protein
MNTDDSHHDQLTTSNHRIDALHKAATPTSSRKPGEQGNRTRAGIPMPSAAGPRRGGAGHGA